MEGIATITATLEGEQVKDHESANRGDLTSLLGSIFTDGDVSVTIHEVHDMDQLEDVKARYESRYNARVTEEM